ncbi:urease accessory protein UreF [Pseudohoeflea suaedae]|nr:urease accessory protein UreF [Pseudohoeflea suaedae]
MAMTIDTAALVRLMSWLSPAFPVGGFNYSHGLEQAVAAELVSDRETLKSWLDALTTRGSAWNDLVLLAEAWRQAGEGGDLAETAQLAEALAGSSERHLETMNQGSAFLAAASAWGQGIAAGLGPRAALPVAVGACAARSGLPLEATLAAYLQAFLSNQVQAAQRLMPIGQTGGIDVLSTLEPLIGEIAARASRSTLDDLGSSTLNADIAAMRHETMPSRIFVS